MGIPLKNSDESFYKLSAHQFRTTVINDMVS